MAVILPYKSKQPKIDPTALIAPNATIIGDVTIMEGANVWFNAVIRGDLQPIVIGKYTNIQDNATVHVMGDTPTIIGDYVTIGHNTLIHCSKIGDNCLIRTIPWSTVILRASSVRFAKTRSRQFAPQR